MIRLYFIIDIGELHSHYTYMPLRSSWFLLSVIKKNHFIFFGKMNKSTMQINKTESKLLLVVECLNQFIGILFVYKIHLYLYHKHLLYSNTLIEFQRLIFWKLIIKTFGPNIVHIDVVDNKVSDMKIILPLFNKTDKVPVPSRLNIV